MKIPALRCSDPVERNAARQREQSEVGAKRHPCFSPWLIANEPVVDPPIDTAPL